LRQGAKNFVGDGLFFVCGCKFFFNLFF